MKEYKLTQGSSVLLDLIRGVSAQIVVIGHGISFFGIFKFLHQPNFPWMQNIAVLVFFLLSGFLISYTTVRKKLNLDNYSFKYYFIDRFSRIYVAFVPAIIFVLFIDLLSIYVNSEAYSFSNAFNIKTFVGNLFMLQDYSLFNLLPEKFITSFGSARTFWTLAIEWWIYLFFGYLILVFCKRNKMSFSNLLILAFLSVFPLFNLINGRGNGLTTYWLFGSMIYLIASQNILKAVNQNVKILFAITLSGLAGVRVIYTMEGFEPIFAFLLAIIMLLLIDIFKEKQFSKKTIKLIQFNASYSYTLYLVHYSIIAFIYAHFRNVGNPYLLFTLGFVISNVVSFGIGYYSETVLTKKVKLLLYKYSENKTFANNRY